MAFQGVLRADGDMKVVIGPVVAVGDGFTPVTNLDISTADEAEILKHNAAAVTSISGNTFAAIASADGYYNLTVTAAQLDTEGMLTVLINDDSLCLPVRASFMVVNANVYDSLYAAAATDYLQIDVKQLLGTAWLTPGVAGTPDVNTKLLGGTAQTGNDVGADVNDILTDTGTTLDTLIKDIPTVAEFEARTIVTADYPTEIEMTAAFTEIKGATWAAGTDTLEHIRNKQTDIETDTAEIGTAGAGLTDLGGMSSGMQTEVNNQVVDVIKTDTISEMAQGVPAATPTLEDAIMYIYMHWRNETTTTSSTHSLKNNAGTVIAKATISDDSTTYTKAEYVSGP